MNHDQSESTQPDLVPATVPHAQVALRASSAARYAACPASYWREHGLPDRAVAPEIRATGERIHAFIAATLRGKNTDAYEIPDDDRNTAEYLIGRARGILSGHGNVTQWLMLDDPAPLKGYGWTGHPDAVALAGDESLHCFDWKGGWLDVPDADANLQLRVYAVILHEYCPRDKIFCHIVARTGVSSTLYAPTDICNALAEVQTIKDNVRSAERAKGNPGESQCRYCRAFCTVRCPETCALVPTAAKVLPSVALIAALPASDVARTLPMVAMVKAACAALEARAKALLAESPDAFGGVWALEDGNTRREIKDAGEGYARTAQLVTEAQAFAACKMSRKSLIDSRAENIVDAAKSGGIKVTKKDAKKQAADEIDACLGDLIETKQNAPSLKYVGETKQITGV